jgi:hypothetical protein
LKAYYFIDFIVRATGAAEMSIVFERLAHEPIVISTSSEPLHSERAARQAVEVLVRYLQEIPGNAYYISDTTPLNLLSFTDVVFGLATLT